MATPADHIASRVEVPAVLLHPTGRNLPVVHSDLSKDIEADRETAIQTKQQLMRRATAGNEYPKLYQFFFKFTEFPVELQLAIWKLACTGHEPRVVEVTSDYSKRAPASITAAPALLHACSRSRQVARTVFQELHLGGQFTGTYINLSRDTLFLNSHLYKEHFNCHNEAVGIGRVNWSKLKGNIDVIQNCKQLALSALSFYHLTGFPMPSAAIMGVIEARQNLLVVKDVAAEPKFYAKGGITLVPGTPTAEVDSTLVELNKQWAPARLSVDYKEIQRGPGAAAGAAAKIRYKESRDSHNLAAKLQEDDQCRASKRRKGLL